MAPSSDSTHNTPTDTIFDQLVVAGFNHHTASQGLRDQLFIPEDAIPAFYGRLNAAGFGDLVVLSTCDRVEIVVLDADPASVEHRLKAVFAATTGMDAAELNEGAFSLSGPHALSHLFAISASLESQVVGEPEVLGQVKEAQRQADGAGYLGSGLKRIFERSYVVAKQVRTETTIGESAFSLAAAACQAARDVVGHYEDAHALLIGAGDINVPVVEKLRLQGLRHITVVDVFASRADALSRRLGAHVLGMDGIADVLAETDIVLAGLGSAQPIIMASSVLGALKKRRFKPMFFLDAAVPKDVDSAVGKLDGAYLFTLDDLERIALKGQEQRTRAAIEARLIVDDAVENFMQAEAVRMAAPLVVALRGHFEAMRAEILAENPGVTAQEATQLLINRLLHGPYRALRKMGGSIDDGESLPEAELLSRLFGLEKDKD